MSVEVGKKAPAFQLPNHDGDVVGLDKWAGKWLVLYFYPRDDTPG
jgi:peroxiredoxin Q/BCP